MVPSPARLLREVVMAAVSVRSSCVVAEHPGSDLERDGERLFQD
jgi:hypothetical protein